MTLIPRNSAIQVLTARRYGAISMMVRHSTSDHLCNRSWSV